ncbi:hypothetical protein PSEUDO8AS_50108 [Pseudomonas sp. 8AS]|nr:hypothetical protein PSEUDO8AS_50108 [Pseudomonas sp. 8AS]
MAAGRGTDPPARQLNTFAARAGRRRNPVVDAGCSLTNHHRPSVEKARCTITTSITLPACQRACWPRPS